MRLKRKCAMKSNVHEINNLIVSIQSIAQLIKDGMMDEEMINDLILRTEKLKELINASTSSKN